MRHFKIFAVSAMAMVALLHSTGDAAATHKLRMRVLWPKIYAPEITGNIYRDEWDDEDDEDFLDLETREEYIRRHRHDRRVVLDLYEDPEDLEPDYYDPPPKKKVKAKKPAAKSATVKKAPSRTATTAAIVKPKVKPQGTTTASITQPSTSKPAVITGTTGSKMALAVPQTVAPKTQAVLAAPAAKPVPKPAPTSQVASAASAGNVIGCSKGAEIVSGYGFTSVKPRTCTGASYSFAATRGATGYLIKLSSATGEITDVQKLK